MKIKCFCFWFIVLSVTFSSEAMVFEQPAVRTARLAISANSFRRCFTQSAGSIRGFSEEVFSPYRKVHTYLPGNNPIFPILSTINYQRDQKARHSNWRLLTAGVGLGIAAALFGEEVHAESSLAKAPKDLTDEELGQCLLEGRKKIDAGYKQLKSINKKNSVLIIGNTGEGKTVLSLYLAGHEPVFKETETGDKTVDFPQAQSLVGHDQNESCTLYPELRFAEDIALWDCPGFRDTRGRNYRLAASVFLDYLTKLGEGESFLVVVDDHSLQGGRGNFFRELLKDISNLLTNSNGELFDSTSDKGTLLDSLVWVITKSPEKRTPKHVEKIITNKEDWFLRQIGAGVAALASAAAKILADEGTQADKEIIEREELTRKEKALVSSCKNNHLQLNFEAQNREEILSHIRKSKVVVDVRSTFVDAEQRKDLVAFSEKVFTRAIELEQESEKARRERDELDNSLQVKRQLQTLDLPGFLRIVSNEIESVKTKRKESEKRYLEHKKDLDELLQRDKEEISVWDEPPQFQRRTRLLPGVMNPVYSTFYFNYEDPKKPFVRVEVEKDTFTEQKSCLGESGIIPVPFSPTVTGWKAFLHKGEVPRHSATYKLEKPSNKFSATYEGGRGRECRVKVKLYGERSKLAITGVVKELHERNLQETESELRKFDKNLRFFEHLQDLAQDKGLKAARKRLEESETDLGSEQKLTALIEQTERLKQELENQRGIGFSLLAMGPKHLLENPAAQQFKKQFNEGNV